ncbi:MAG: hypothetical protein FWC57_00940 [Endomicrobia bacterium]|nr:hypothetical protein [Endomicrobiia bacterium]
MTDKLHEAFLMRFQKFGVNKTRETLRLIEEIAKREGVPPLAVLDSLAASLPALPANDYASVKEALLKRRYPSTFGKTSYDSFYLPKYEIDPQMKADVRLQAFSPKNVYFQKEAAETELFERVKTMFPKANYTEIPSLKEFMKENSFSVSDYNGRCDNLFLTEEKYDFFKKCPCTSGVVNCGYSIMNLGMGCPYECSYCFLQGYQNVPGIVIPFNINEYLKDEKLPAAAGGFFGAKRIGSGEFTDSLVFDNITEFSKPIISFFKERQSLFLEFKTKSVNIENLLKSGGAKNIVAAWSVNSVKMAEENEFKAPDIEARLKAAKECARAGFSTAFHFDPMIFYDGWMRGYGDTVDMIFDIVPADSIKWISLGALRMPAAQKTIIENRFPDSKILDGELLLGKDYKLRYHEDIRNEMFRFMAEKIKSKKSKAAVYLCMEESGVWRKAEVEKLGSWEAEQRQ